jgi:hypothetical protein
MLFWVITQRGVVILYRRFDTTYLSHLHFKGPLKMGRYETSVRNYHYTLRNNTEGWRSHLLRGGSLKSRTVHLYGEATIRWSRDSKQFLNSGQLNMKPIGCSKTSARNYHYSLRNNTKGRSSRLLRYRSLKSRSFPFRSKALSVFTKADGSKVHKINLFKIERGWTRWGQSKIKGGSHWSITWSIRTH